VLTSWSLLARTTGFPRAHDDGGAHKIDSAEKAALAVAEILADGKGEEVTVLAVKGMTLIADYFVIASGTSQRHVKSLADRVLEGMEQVKKLSHVEGYENGSWVLLDYGDVVVHIFRRAERAFYGLERLWGDAPRLVRA